MVELEQDDMVPPSYALAVTLRDMQALYAGGHIPSGTTVTKQEPNPSDLFLRSTVYGLRSTVWATADPTKYVRIFDGLQDTKIKPLEKE